MPRISHLTRASQCLNAQQRWVNSRGGNREGYRLHYAGCSDTPEHSRSIADGIYAADRAALDRLAAEFSALVNR